MKRFSLTLILAAIALFAGGPAVRMDRVMADIAFLCSPELQGRATLQPGAGLVSRFLAAEFRKAGLKPFDGKEYLQEFRLVTTVLDRSASHLVLDRDGSREILKPGEGFQGGFKEDVRLKAGMVFAGYGITAPEYGYDDYAGLDVRGKVAVILSGEPRQEQPAGAFRGSGLTVHSAIRVKRMNAQTHGAAAVVVLPASARPRPAAAGTPRTSTPPAAPGSPALPRGWASVVYDEEIAIPLLDLNTRAAGRVLPGYRQLQERIDAAGKPASREIPGTLEVELVQKERQSGTTSNVIGVMEGSDPRLKSEAIILSAHYDHLPSQGEAVYPGANDNASGVAAILELARLAAEHKVKPKRTLVFIAFGAEENGLIGAYHYAAHPVLPLGGTRAVLNLDMIGRDEAHIPRTEGRVEIPARTSDLLNLAGGAWSPELAASARRIAAGLGLRIDSKYDADASQSVLWRSDHFPFLVQGVPAVWIFAGFHPGYHEVSDTPEKLNLAKMEKIIRLTYALALQLAGASKPPAFRAE